MVTSQIERYWTRLWDPVTGEYDSTSILKPITGVLQSRLFSWLVSLKPKTFDLQDNGRIMTCNGHQTSGSCLDDQERIKCSIVTRTASLTKGNRSRRPSQMKSGVDKRNPDEDGQHQSFQVIQCSADGRHCFHMFVFYQDSPAKKDTISSNHEQLKHLLNLMVPATT